MIKEVPNTKTELVEGLQSVIRECRQFIQAEDIQKLSVKPDPAVWSPIEELVHLIKSMQPVGLALGLPRLMPRVMFGSTKQGSKTYETIIQEYKGKLSQGAKASKSFSPSTTTKQYDKQKLLNQWDKIGQQLIHRVSACSDQDLDKYRLPHPILGKLTFREMLFFTHFHIGFHIESMQRKVAAV